jgi:hypothetical protein
MKAMRARNLAATQKVVTHECDESPNLAAIQKVVTHRKPQLFLFPNNYFIGIEFRIISIIEIGIDSISVNNGFL